MTDIVDLNKVLSNSPGHRRKSHGKFVLISRGEQEWFVLGVPKHYPYHATLVAAFCDRESLPYHWERRPDIVRIEHTFTSIDGGGMFELDREAGILRLGGESRAYGPVNHRDLLALASGLGTPLDLTVIVGG